MSAIPDRAERDAAVSTFDRGVVVTASAGTGKTTLLVERALHLLLGERRGKPGLSLPVRPEELLAVTFAEKAAGEMRRRLRDALADLARAEGAGWIGEVSERLGRVHSLSPAGIRGRASEALPDLGRAHITTIHSLAAEILRSYPRDAGVDPRFRVDSGPAFDALFEERWDRFLGDALEGASADDRARWSRILEKVSLEELGEAARALCGFEIPDEALPTALREPAGGAMRGWFAEREAEARALGEFARSLPGEHDRKVDLAVFASERYFAALGIGDEANRRAAREGVSRIQGDLGKVTGWDSARYSQARRLFKAASRLASFDGALAADLEATVLPFATGFRREFLRRGWISFSGLLALAGGLLRRDVRVREALQRRFRAVLVDEFQDTDPAQGEIVLYLCEEEGRSASRLEEVRVAPGKLFLVGDEKQSIYSFRGVDLEGCRAVSRRSLETGRSLTLRTSFRSTPGIVRAVNGLFAPLFVEGEFQAPYAPLEPLGPLPGGEPVPPVEIRLRHRGPEAPLAPEAAAIDAEAVAERLQSLRSEEEIEWKRMALLFRAFTWSHVYLGALQRRGIPYVSEGEKFFYTCQEVLDLVNLLAAVADPGDRTSLAGVLRSPFGGLRDRDLFELAEAGAIDYRVEPPATLPCAGTVAPLYRSLREDHARARHEPLEGFLDGLFERHPLLEIAGSGRRGAQVVANVEKLWTSARSLAARPEMTLPRLVAELRRREIEREEEGEAAIFEEGVDAVRVLSIHRAKGLEFDVVVVPSVHTTQRFSPPDMAWARFERPAGVAGVRIRDFRSPGAVLVEDRRSRREEAERLRLLYVVSTRARRRLVWSGVSQKGADESFLSMLYRGGRLGEGPPEAGDLEEGKRRERRLDLDGALVREIVEPPPDLSRKPPSKKRAAFDPPDPEGVADACAARERAYRAAISSPLLVRASDLGAREDDAPEEILPADVEAGDLQVVAAPPRARSRGAEDPAERARTVGTICHRVLEAWEFGAPAESLVGALEPALDGEGLREGRDAVAGEAREVLEGFLRSPIAARLARAQILARELPVLVRLDDRFVHGVADVVFEEDGEVVVADYKSDDVDESGARSREPEYREQCRAYAEAVRSALGLRGVRAVLLFLRPSVAIEVECASGSPAGAS